MKNNLLLWVVWVITFILVGVVVYCFYFYIFGTFYLIHTVKGQGLVGKPPVIQVNPQPPFVLEGIEQVKTGCDYWYSVIDGLEATYEEKAWLKQIAFCESTCSPSAVSYMGATGLMQFMPETFNWMGGKDITDSYEQIELALEMYRKGMANHWCCSKLI